MAQIQKNVREFAFIGFILLAVLFGMQIMVFIFGSLGSADFLADDIIVTANETGAYINITGYQLNAGASTNFTGASIVTIFANATGETTYLIPATNYTVNQISGLITNNSLIPNATEYNDVNISYTSTHKTEAEVVSDETTNQSLRAIGDYSGQAGTQFTTLGIAITLILLVAVFLFFWKSFMGKGKGKSAPGSFS